MKKLLLIATLLFTSSTVLNAECTKEQKVKMIINGTSQESVDKLCSKKKVIVKKKRIAPKRYATKRSRVYVGFTAGVGGGTLVRTYDAQSEVEYESESDILYFKASLGYVFQSNDRIEVAYTNISADFASAFAPFSENITTFDAIELNYIYTIGQKQVEVGSIRPFVLVGIGTYGSDDIDYDANEDTGGIGMKFGVGMIYPIDNYIELDLSYEVNFVNYDDYYYSYSSMSNVELFFPFGSISAAVRYKF